MNEPGSTPNGQVPGRRLGALVLLSLLAELAGLAAGVAAFFVAYAIAGRPESPEAGAYWLWIFPALPVAVATTTIVLWLGLQRRTPFRNPGMLALLIAGAAVVSLAAFPAGLAVPFVVALLFGWIWPTRERR